MKKVLELIIQLFRFHKLKILLALISSGLFMALRFPFSDLTDLMTAKVLQGTNNQVLFQAEKLDLSLVPPISVGGENISVHAPVTGSWEEFQTIELGQIQIKQAGNLMVKVRANDAASWKAINLNSVQLIPVD